jgi:hypothetical protein
MAYTDDQFHAGFAETAASEAITQHLYRAMQRRTEAAKQFKLRLDHVAEQTCGKNSEYFKAGYYGSLIEGLARSVPGVAEYLDNCLKTSVDKPAE